MNQTNDCTPVALYARVSSDRQDVDLSVAAQLRALRDYADKEQSGMVLERLLFVLQVWGRVRMDLECSS